MMVTLIIGKKDVLDGYGNADQGREKGKIASGEADNPDIRVNATVRAPVPFAFQGPIAGHLVLVS